MTVEPDREAEMSTAVRVASATGVFILGVIAVPALLLLGANLLGVLGLDNGGAAIAILFGVVGAPTAALLRSQSLRPLAVGGLLGLTLSVAAVFFYVVVLKAGDF